MTFRAQTPDTRWRPGQEVRHLPAWVCLCVLLILISTRRSFTFAQQQSSPSSTQPERQPPTQPGQQPQLPNSIPQEAPAQPTLDNPTPVPAPNPKTPADSTSIPSPGGTGAAHDGAVIDERSIPSIAAQQPDAPGPSSTLNRTAQSGLAPRNETPASPATSFLDLLAPYHRPRVPQLSTATGPRLASLIRDGKLYLSLHDAIALAIENNLDVEVERFNLVLAETDIKRARGGGTTRGIDFTLAETPAGVGGPGTPLLNAAAVAVSPTNPSVTDLSSLNASTGLVSNLSVTGTLPYSAGPSIPLFDPNLIAQLGYLRRSNTVSLTNAGGTNTGIGTSGNTGVATNPAPLQFAVANLAYIQGFSTGAQLEAIANNDSQVIYANDSQYDPFHSPSTSVTLTQPLLRGFGRGVNLRYLRIARLDRSASRLLFEQQVINTVYGVARLYYDLVSLGENVAVKQETLAAAQKLYNDDAAQVELGTLAPIELTRARALVASSNLDLVQAQGQYRQEEVILRSQLVRSNAGLGAGFSAIVPTDRITVPDTPDPLPVLDLMRSGLANRRDLAQAALQVRTGALSVSAARNQALPQLNLYANVETRGSAEAPYEQLGTVGTALTTTPAQLALGGLRTSTIYQAGVQLTLPLRNRVAESDAARDATQMHQAEARTVRLENQVRAEIEDSIIALENAHTAYRAAVESRHYQEELLGAEREKLGVGASTNYAIVQDEAYLAQARSTEVAARSDWQKARIALDRAVGDLLEKYGIVLDEAVTGSLQDH